MALAENSLSACLRRWSGRLAETSDSPRLDAEVLFKHVSGYTDTQLIVALDGPVTTYVQEHLEQMIEARWRGTPVAYLTGQREFFSLSLMVNPDVLIPRPDTECLVEAALTLIETKSLQTALDLGTGSGAIALALAQHAPGLQITATDRVPAALDVAIQNAKNLMFPDIHFICSDWYQDLPVATYDLIVSNPPYIDPQDAHLQQGDVRFEPHSALVAGAHGLADLQQIILGSRHYLKDEGWILLEHGFDQAQDVRALFDAASFNEIETLKDLSQNDRVTIARSPGPSALAQVESATP